MPLLIRYSCYYLIAVFLCSCSTLEEQKLNDLDLSIAYLEILALRGEDLDKDGIRDDMLLFIQDLHISDLQRQKAMAYAQVLQSIVSSVDKENCPEALNKVKSLKQATEELLQVSNASFNQELFNIIREKQLDTESRKNKYNNFTTEAQQCYQKL